jgi:hypothetical protein
MQNMRQCFCGKKGITFYELHHSAKELLEWLATLAERNSLAAIYRVKGIKEETVIDCLRIIRLVFSLMPCGLM